MCGICGIIHFDYNQKVNEQELVKMRDSMEHRGPDGMGVFIDNNVGLGHRRLSIIDVSNNALQPMSNADETIWIVFNGEFYNYAEYISDLKGKGYVFKSTSDTEVLLYLYQEYGIEETLKRINGMFAFCIYDKRKDQIVIARDRFGIKPLYYTKIYNSFAFASEIKAFYHLKGFVPKIRENAIAEYFLYLRTADFTTLLEGVFEVKPSSYLVIKNQNIIEKKYYDLNNFEENSNISFDDAIEELDRLFTQSVKYQMISDVPVGVFLSGGLDSSIIAYKMAELTNMPINSVSAGYVEKEADEFFWSDQVVEIIKSNHKKFYDNPEIFFDLIPWLTYINDRPLQGGISFYTAAKFAKQNCTVMLCGQGSDEIFAGYPGFIYGEKQHNINSIVGSFLGETITYKLHNFLPKVSKRKIFRKVGGRIHLNDHRLAAAYSGSIPEEDFLKFLNKTEKDYLEVLDKYECLWDYKNKRNFTSKMLYSNMNLGLQNLLHDTDRLTMAASVETRVPFLDHNFVEFIYTLPSNYKVKDGQGKYILKKYLERYFPKEFIYRPKKGFPIPFTQWFNEGKIDFSLNSKSCIDKHFNAEYIEKYKKIVKSGILGTSSRDPIQPLLRYYVLKVWESNINNIKDTNI